ncbi:MAG TPA: DNA replication and repair protein RecF [Cytophagales bacterium]|jgi:DNA replication and repair protein RecF|nr:DNA replication and repair protein RecF [Cytophagales bacterium]
MFLENIYLNNFKNYSEVSLTFSEGINSLVGKNGSGKTNLLDAIYYLCFTKSAFNAIDIQNIRHEQPYFAIRGRMKKHEHDYAVSCSLKTGHKKRLKLNNKDLDRASELIGLFPAVLIAPNDGSIITEGSEMRRKFFDGMMCQLSRTYLQNLVHYNHTLKQRNTLLKLLAENSNPDADLLDTYDVQMIVKGTQIYHHRKNFIEKFTHLLNKHYDFISSEKEHVSCKYKSDLDQNEFKLLLRESRNRDVSLQRTSRGIHRDDVIFEIDNYALKKFGSQGQQKSFLIALKLAQFDIMEQDTNTKPILMLDDIFDKLDDDRIGKLLKLIDDHFFGQVFITDARPERTMQFLNRVESPKKIFEIEDGFVIRERSYES